MAARPLAFAIAGASVAFGAWVAGCEALVPGQLDDVLCSAEGAVGPPACPDGHVCQGGHCIASDLGAACEADTDCVEGDFCLDPALLGERGPRVCARPCCSSSECDPDPRFVCWNAPGGAGSLCRAAADVGRAEGGAGRPLAACARDADCRSGRCAGGRCAEPCCTDGACADEGGACVFGAGPADEAAGFWCTAAALGRKPVYALCQGDADCASGLCVALAAGTAATETRCSIPCCGSADCAGLPDKGTPVACAPVQVGTTWVRACSLVVLGLAAGAVGSPCKQDGDCRSGACLGEAGAQRCSDGCCTADGCGDPASFVCGPATGSSSWASWALRCEPR